MLDFRTASGTRIDWIDTQREDFSNFLYVDRELQSSPVVRRIFSLARKLEFQSLLSEEISDGDCHLLQSENEALAIREGSFCSSRVRRFSFFDQPTEGENLQLLGYLIFKEDTFSSGEIRSHVYEAVMRPDRCPLSNNFLHAARSYEVHTSLGHFRTRGSLYAQQNDLTSVCAHVGLRSALASVLPEGDITNDRINKIIGIDHRTRKVGSGVGLSPEDMEAVITGCGLSFGKLVHEPSKKDPSLVLKGEFQRDLYGLIESGYPALLGFELDGSQGRHIIPLLGHTFNEDLWVADSGRHYFEGDLGYLSSESWMSSYVVHDDNFGPYFCIPRHYLKKENFRLALGIRPQQPASEALEVEAASIALARALATTFAGNGTKWQQRYRLFAEENLLVLRTLLISREEYVQHLRMSRSWRGKSHADSLIARVKATLPDNIWMVELSAPELFSASRHKFGELIITADQEIPDPLTMDILLFARLPGLCFVREGEGFAVENSGIQSHLPLALLSSLYQIEQPNGPKVS